VSFFVRQIPGECLTVQVSLTIRGCTSMLIRVWYWVFTIEWVVVYMRGVRHWDCWWWFIVVYFTNWVIDWSWVYWIVWCV